MIRVRSAGLGWTVSASIWLAGCSSAPPTHITVTVAQTPLRLELAITEEQIRTGMMHRPSLGHDAGILFIFPDEKPRRFWMKNCLVPLDVIFLDSQGRIVSIRTMSVPTPREAEDPPSYPSDWPTQFAIELNASRAAELGLKPGDRLDLPLEKLKAWAR